MIRLTLLITLVLLLPQHATAINGVNKCRKQFYAQKLEALVTCKNQAMINGAPEKGHPEAQKILADMYYWGWGDALQRDYKEAVRWYKRAAVAGDTASKFALGVLYEQGKGIAANYQRAIKWYTSAASNGHLTAQFNLASMYSKGAGTRQNHQRASMWYEKAANQGDSESAYNMGNRYARGQGVERNAAKAYKWFLIAKDLTNDADAEESLKFLKKELTQSQIKKGVSMFKAWRPKRENINITY